MDLAERAFLLLAPLVAILAALLVGGLVQAVGACIWHKLRRRTWH
jgi:hypothetical protein